MDKIACQSIIIDSGDTSVKHQADVTDNDWTYVIRPGSNFSAYGSKIRTYITSIRPLTEALTLCLNSRRTGVTKFLDAIKV